MSELSLDLGEENKTAVLMMTCNKYKPLWSPFFQLLRKYWPDCPYKIYMGTDIGNLSEVETISTNKVAFCFSIIS
jgi:hypothetical protein